jgi:hypothetical protein
VRARARAAAAGRQHARERCAAALRRIVSSALPTAGRRRAGLWFGTRIGQPNCNTKQIQITVSGCSVAITGYKVTYYMDRSATYTFASGGTTVIGLGSSQGDWTLPGGATLAMPDGGSLVITSSMTTDSVNMIAELAFQVTSLATPKPSPSPATFPPSPSPPPDCVCYTPVEPTCPNHARSTCCTAHCCSGCSVMCGCAYWRQRFAWCAVDVCPN